MNRTAAAHLARAEDAQDAQDAKQHREFCQLIGVPETATRDERNDAFKRSMDDYVNEYEREHGELVPLDPADVDWKNLSLLTGAEFVAACKGLMAQP